MTAGRSLPPIAAALERQRQDDFASRQAADRHFDRFMAALTRRTSDPQAVSDRVANIGSNMRDPSNGHENRTQA